MFIKISHKIAVINDLGMTALQWHPSMPKSTDLKLKSSCHGSELV